MMNARYLFNIGEVEYCIGVFPLLCEAELCGTQEGFGFWYDGV